MAIIVRHKVNQRDYILLGGGFGAYQSKKPDISVKPELFFGNSAVPDKGEYPMVCVCNPKGHIVWFYSDAVLVISVDGYPVTEIID